MGDLLGLGDVEVGERVGGREAGAGGGGVMSEVSVEVEDFVVLPPQVSWGHAVRFGLGWVLFFVFCVSCVDRLYSVIKGVFVLAALFVKLSTLGVILSAELLGKRRRRSCHGFTHWRFLFLFLT